MFLRQGLVASPGNDQLCATHGRLPPSIKVIDAAGAAVSLQDCTPCLSRRLTVTLLPCTALHATSLCGSQHISWY